MPGKVKIIIERMPRDSEEILQRSELVAVVNAKRLLMEQLLPFFKTAFCDYLEQALALLQIHGRVRVGGLKYDLRLKMEEECPVLKKPKSSAQ